MAQIKLAEYTFDNTLADCYPLIVPSNVAVIKEDTVNGNITTRILSTESETPVTRIQFAIGSIPHKQSLLTVEYLNMKNITDMSNTFNYCQNVSYINTDGWGVNNVTTFDKCFSECYNLANINVANINVSKAENVSGMFQHCSSLTELDLSSWNTGSCKNMSSMFANCRKLQSLDLSSFNTSNVKDMGRMFNYCSNLIALDLSNFNTSSVTKMNHMFADCFNLQSLDLSNFDTSNVGTMSYMFTACQSLQSLDLSNFSTSSTAYMNNMFENCGKLTYLDLSNFDITKVSSIGSIFKNCHLKQIGLLYSDSTTINKVAENLYATSNCDIYYLDANRSELKVVSNVTYVQYKENVLYLPPTLTLRSNGDVCDEYNPFTSQFVQRIGEDGSVLDSPVTTTVKSIVAYNDTVKYGYALPDKTTDLYHPEVESYEQVIDSTTLNGTENWTKVNQTTFTTPFTNAKSETSTEVFTMKDDVESITIVNDTLSLIFKETSYVTTNNIAVNALKIWLQTNNVEFKYELKERIFTDMTLEEFDFDNAHFVKPQAYKGGAITQSNKDDLIFAPITYQTKSNNRYELPLLDSSSEYTLHYEGSVSEVDLGGSTNSSVESNGLVQSGSSDKVALFDDEVSNVMLIKGDVREQTTPYFQGLLSTQAPTLATRTTKYTNHLENPDISIEAYKFPNSTIVGGWNVFDLQVGNKSGSTKRVINSSETTGDDIFYLAFDIVRLNNGLYHQDVPFCYRGGGFDQHFMSGATYNSLEVGKEVHFTYRNVNSVPSDQYRSIQITFSGYRELTQNIQFKIKNVVFVNLTLMYGRGNEPTKEWCDENIGYAKDNEIHYNKSSILSTPKDIELRSMGNVCDTLDCKTGKLVKYFGEIVLDGNEDENWQETNKTTDTFIMFRLASTPKCKLVAPVCSSFKTYCTHMPNIDDTNGELLNLQPDNNSFQFIINKSKLTSPDIDGFKQWLSQNPVTVQYLLEEPTTTTVNLDIEYKEGDKKYIVRTHDDVTHVNVSSEGLAPITEIGYITNEDNVETVTLEDGMVTLENAKPHSVIQRAILKGNTLVNLAQPSLRAWTMNLNSDTASLKATTEEFIIDWSKGVPYNAWIQARNDNSPVFGGMLKADTDYTFIIRILENNPTFEGVTVTGDIASFQIWGLRGYESVRIALRAGVTGTIVLKCKFNRILTTQNNENIFGIAVGGTAVDGTKFIDGGKLRISKDIIILEGDYTNNYQDIPYFEGMQSVKMPVLKTTGKNLFNFDDYEWKQGGLNDAGNQGTTPSHSSFINTDKVPIEKLFMSLNKKAYLTCERSNSGGWVQIFFYDKDGKTCGRCLNHGQQIYLPITINVPTNAKFFRMQLATDDLSSVVATYDKADCIPYTQHKSNILQTPEDIELHSVGDVKDTLNLLTGELTKRFGVAVMDGSDDEVYIDNWDSVSFAISHNNPIFDNIKINSVNIISDKYVYEWIHGDNTGKSGFYWQNNCLWFRTPLENIGGSHTQQAFKTWLQSNPITVIYELDTPIAKTVDLTLTQQNVPSEKMTYFKDYYGQLVSDGTLPKFTYRLESTNTYNVSQLKPNTLYTMYSEGEATVATLGGKASILLNNPQTLTSGTQNKSLTFDSPTSKVVLIEKDVTNQVVPYFTGTLDTVNPTIKTTSGNKSNTISTNVCLRSVGDVCDTYDLNTGTLVKRVGEDHRVLDHPETSNIPVNAPVAYHGATVEMSSNELSLLPRFEYSCKSPNYYPLPVESNEVYTLKFDKTSNGTLTMGGVTANTTGNQTITTKNSDVQGVLFSGDLGIGNLMVMKTDVRNVPTPYFRGIRSVVNPTITVSDGGTQSNSVALTLTMRSLPNGVKDELNLVTGEYIQRLDQRNFAEGDVNGRDMITDGTTTIYPLTVPRRSTLELNWSDGVLTAYDGTTNVTSEAELLKPHLFFQLATSTLEEIISQLKDENASLLETVATLEEDNLSTMVAVTEVFETVLVMMPMTLSVNNDTKGGGSYMVEVYVTLILKGKKTLEQVPAVIRPQVEQMLKDVDAL